MTLLKQSLNTWFPPVKPQDGLIPFVTGLESKPKIGFIDASHQVKISAQFDDAMPFNNGKFLVRLGARYGIMKKDGIWLVHARYKTILPEAGGRYLFETPNERWGFMDIEGRIVIPATFESAESFTGGFAVVKPFDADFGYIDPFGKPLTDFCYSGAEPFKGGRAEVRKGWHPGIRHYGYIDKRGHFTATKTEKGVSR